jgi:hypothetical protein
MYRTLEIDFVHLEFVQLRERERERERASEEYWETGRLGVLGSWREECIRAVRSSALDAEKRRYILSRVLSPPYSPARSGPH